MEELYLDQLEVGEWYEVKARSGWKGWLHKHASEEDGCAIGSIVSTGEYCDRSVDYKWGTGYTFRKATKEQLKSFLPKDHPDYPIENSDYRWMLFLEKGVNCTNFEKGEIDEIINVSNVSFQMKRLCYIIKIESVETGLCKPFLTKKEAEKYWDKLNQSKPVKTPKTKQLSDLKKGDWAKLILNTSSSNFTTNNLYKLVRDWDDGYGLFYDNRGELNGYGGASNLRNFTVPTQQEIETWEKSLIKNEPKEFVLPEKWCIKQYASQIVCNWFNRNGLSAADIKGSYTYLVYDSVLKRCGYEHKPIYTEITLEQFEKYVLKSKVTIEDKPKEDMKTIPKYWYIENKYQEVRDYLADTYNENCIKNWNSFNYIGFTGCRHNNGCSGFCSKTDTYAEKAIKITIEQFREYFLSKPKETPQDDYSWWYELEEGDVIESLTDVYDTRKKGDRFAVININDNGVSYALGCRSFKKEEWRLISKAKDVKTTVAKDQLGGHVFNTQALIQHRDIADVWRGVYPQYTHMMLPPLVGKVSPVPNDAQKYIMGVDPADGVSAQVYSWGIQQLPQPEETEIVPISKYFKIRN